MAIFETSYTDHICLDDTIPLSCTFINSRIIDGHTEYVIRVHRGTNEDDSWTIIKRYREFVILHRELQASSYYINLPPKRFIGNLNRQFIAERQIQLQKYMDQILNSLVLSSALCVKQFLDPVHYSNSFYATAVQNASMALRDKPDFYDMKPLLSIGWRYRKQYCYLQKHRDYVNEYILSWVEYGPDKCLDDREMQSSLKTMMQLQHSYIVPIIAGSCYNAGALIIRTKCCKGSLRDLIYEQTPDQPFLKKYRYQKELIILPSNALTTIAVQVLHALKFLHEKQIPYGHLHSGNVFIEDNVAKISDIENGILGLPSFYRSYFVNNYRKIHCLEDADVYCFGQVLYEMAFGEQLQNYPCNEIPDDCYSHIRPILELILLDNCKEKLPNVSFLLEHDSFYECSSNVIYETKPYCKLSTHSKEYFSRAKSKIEKRLRDDQRALRKHKRLTHMREIMDSEEIENQNNNDRSHRNTIKKCKVKKATSQMSLGTSSIGESVSSVVSTPTSVSIDIQTSPSFTPDVEHANLKIRESHPPSSATLHSPLPSTDNRTALLQSITHFNKNNLKKNANANI